MTPHHHVRFLCTGTYAWRLIDFCWAVAKHFERHGDDYPVADEESLSAERWEK